MESLALLVSIIMLGTTFANMVVGVVAAKFFKNLWIKLLAGLILPLLSIIIFQNQVIALFMLGGYIITFSLTHLMSNH